MTTIFRQATSSDIPAMSAIRLSVTENVLSDPSRITTRMYEDYLEKDGRGWVAEADGAIVAFSYADRENASIWALFVSPGHEGQGLGSSVLKLAVDWLFSLGHRRITLGTTPATRADRFYAAQGWRRGAVHPKEVEYVLENVAPAANMAPVRAIPLTTSCGVVAIPVSIDQAEDLAALVRQDREHLHPFLPAVARLSSIEAARAHLTAAEGRAADGAILEWHLYFDGALCGSIRLRDIDQDDRKAKIGYFSGSQFAGRGIMTSAVHAVLAYGFSCLGLNRIELRCAAGNERSMRLAERLGFAREGLLRHDGYLNGAYVDNYVYGLLRADFESEPTALAAPLAKV